MTPNPNLHWSRIDPVAERKYIRHRHARRKALLDEMKALREEVAILRIVLHAFQSKIKQPTRR